jgi:hypothetical protein
LEQEHVSSVVFDIAARSTSYQLTTASKASSARSPSKSCPRWARYRWSALPASLTCIGPQSCLLACYPQTT